MYSSSCASSSLSLSSSLCSAWNVLCSVTGRVVVVPFNASLVVIMYLAMSGIICSIVFVMVMSSSVLSSTSTSLTSNITMTLPK